MLFFLIDMLIIAWFVAASWREPEVSSGEHPAAGLPSTSGPAANSRQVFTRPATPSPQRITAGPTFERGQAARERTGEPTSTRLPVWTTLDEHQLTRLLKQSCSRETLTPA